MKRIRASMAERVTSGLSEAILNAQVQLQAKIPHLICPACGGAMLRNPKAALWVCTRFACRYAMNDSADTAYLSHWPNAPANLSCGGPHS